MSKSICYHYSSRAMRRLFTQQLKEIKKILYDIFIQREFNEGTAGCLKWGELLPLQDKLKDKSTRFLNDYCCFLVSISNNLDEVTRWEKSIKVSSTERTPINTDTDELKKNDMMLYKAMSQIEIWLDHIEKNGNYTWRFWIQIKQKWLSYLVALITGIVTGLIGNYLFVILK
jgi:hypothetical protein